MTRSLQFRVNAGFIAALVVLVLTGMIAVWAGHRSGQAADRRQATYQRRDALLTMFSLLQDAETGQRGYLLTGLEPYRAPYDTSVVKLDTLREQVKRLFASAPAAVQRDVAIADSFTVLRLQRIAETIVVRRDSGFAAALRRVGSGLGKSLMDSVRVHVGHAQRAEEATIANLEADAQHARQRALSANVTIVAMATVLFSIAGVVINRDLRQRVAAETALRESEHRWHQILDELPIATFVSDGTGKATFANRASSELLGIDIANVPVAELPDHIATFVAGTDTPFPADQWPLAAALAGHKARTADMELRLADRRLPVEVVAAPILDHSGRVAFAVVLTSDLTERRAAEQVIRSAQASAEAASRAKSDFLARMSHELRTPLNSIIGFSEVLEDETHGPLQPRQQRYVHNVLTSGRQLLDLINDILDLSKIEAGRMDLAPVQMDVAPIIEEVRANVQPLADRKRHTLTVETDESLQPVIADPARVKQILYNLLSNAIKYTPDGGTIGVLTRLRSDEAGSWLEVRVRDTGIGIRAEDHERIFSEFEQADSSYVRQQEGTGLGLALARRLALLHGGSLTLNSLPGQGSTFTLTLPRSGPHSATPPHQMPREPAARAAAPAEPASGRGPRVLVVDDEPQAADLLRHHLTEAGYRVVAAARGDAALAIARELQPDAITLDILLPDADGLVVLTRLKSDPATRHIPVIVVSVTEDRTSVAFSLGAADWLVKPVAREDLLAGLRRVIPLPAAGRTALIVDDDPQACELLSGYLSQDGYRVVTATSGGEGVARARTEQPDVLVLDLLMPDLSGFDVVDAVRQDGGRDLPIVICTSKDVTAEDRARLAGSVQGIVSKGDGRDHLLRELHRAMGARA